LFSESETLAQFESVTSPLSTKICAQLQTQITGFHFTLSSLSVSITGSSEAIIQLLPRSSKEKPQAIKNQSSFFKTSLSSFHL
jgi:hypothetical protein